MKKLLLLFVLCMSFGLCNAQGKVEITLNDGSVVKGVTYNGFIMDNVHRIYLKDIPKGEKEYYESTEVKSVRLFDDKKKEWIIYVPMMAQRTLPNIWAKTPKTYKNPVFLHLLYEGKHVSAYEHCISTYTTTKNHKIEGTNWVYYFKVHDEDVAKTYWMGYSMGLKAELKLVFRKYPQMKDIIKNLDSKEFNKDKIEIIRKFDEALNNK